MSLCVEIFSVTSQKSCDDICGTDRSMYPWIFCIQFKGQTDERTNDKSGTVECLRELLRSRRSILLVEGTGRSSLYEWVIVTIVVRCRVDLYLFISMWHYHTVHWTVAHETTFKWEHFLLIPFPALYNSRTEKYPNFRNDRKPHCCQIPYPCFEAFEAVIF
jgi:hypothetical protein